MASEENTVTLYYFPGSFYSQRVYLTLLLKKVNFRKKLVRIHTSEQDEPSYLKLNPKGVVPTLCHGNNVVVESEVIVDYVDKTFDTGIKLNPDPSTGVGRKVSRWRERFEDIRVEVVTFGALYNPELRNSAPNLPHLMAKPEVMKKMMMTSIERSKKQAEEKPQFREYYLTKGQRAQDRFENACNKTKVASLLDGLETLFDDVEKELKQTSSDQGVIDPCLVSLRLTSADVNLIILLDRLKMVGLLTRYMVQNKRPLLCAYYQRLANVPEVVALRAEVARSGKVMLVGKIKEIVPYVATFAALSVAVAIGVQRFYRMK